MDRPLLLTIDTDGDGLRVIEGELRERYGRDYEVLCMASAGDARTALQERAESGTPVALVLAALSLAGMSGADFLAELRRLHPRAKRALLIDWGGLGGATTGETISDAAAQGKIDHYVTRPLPPPDEAFHQAISSFLLEWAEGERIAPHAVQVVGDSWSGRAYELRNVLQSCAFPHSFSLADSPEGAAVLDRATPNNPLPVVVMPDGSALTDPSDIELARVVGTPPGEDDAPLDLVIVGAGPAGLAAAVYGASEGLRTSVIDSGGIGGQASSSSMIRNYLGFPRGISGSRLAQQAHEQAWILGARFAFFETVTELRRGADGIIVRLDDEVDVHTRAVILATGASYRRLGVPNLESLIGAGVYYGGTASEAATTGGEDVLVLGGANSAGQAALHLAQYARRVTLVARGRSLDAGMSRYLVRQLEVTPNVDVRLESEIVDGGADADGWLDHVVLRTRSGTEERLPADELFVMIGADPLTDWLPPEVSRDERGFILTGADVPREAWPLARAPLGLETSMPSVLAVGDARYGSVKRVASAAGEGSVAIQALHQILAIEPQHVVSEGGIRH